MSDNVFRIGGAVLPGEAHEGVVEILEKLLEEAKAGLIIGIAYTVVHPDAGAGEPVNTGWGGGPGSRWPLFCGTRLLDMRYAAQVIGGSKYT
jgi:hypothetical protein